MKLAWFAGVDWGSEKHQVCVLDAAGKVLGEREFEHSGTGLSQMASWVLSLATGDAGEVGVAVETPRGPVVESLMERGFAVHSINPKQLDRFRDRLSPAGAKDDRPDARVLASALRTDPHFPHSVGQANAFTRQFLAQTRPLAQLDDCLPLGPCRRPTRSGQPRQVPVAPRPWPRTRARPALGGRPPAQRRLRDAPQRRLLRPAPCRDHGYVSRIRGRSSWCLDALAVACGREGARDPVRGVSTVLRDRGADRRRRTCRQSIEGQPSGWPARASRTVGRGSHPKDRSVAEDPRSGLTAVADRAW